MNLNTVVQPTRCCSFLNNNQSIHMLYNVLNQNDPTCVRSMFEMSYVTKTFLWRLQTLTSLFSAGSTPTRAATIFIDQHQIDIYKLNATYALAPCSVCLLPSARSASCALQRLPPAYCSVCLLPPAASASRLLQRLPPAHCSVCLLHPA